MIASCVGETALENATAMIEIVSPTVRVDPSGDEPLCLHTEHRCVSLVEVACDTIRVS